jgi:molybdopterin converting factor subunit 1
VGSGGTGGAARAAFCFVAIDYSQMQVQVLFFGMLKDLAGRAGDTIDLADGSTLRDVFTHYEARVPRLMELKASIAMSVNQEYAGLETVLNPGDEVALLPPVSGGAPETADGTSAGQLAEPALNLSKVLRYKSCNIVREKIDTHALLNDITQPADGAAVIFEGIVRDNTRGRRTLYLDYEAYEDMALKQMEGLAEQALSQFKVRDVAIVHRLGRLEIGETSVLIIVASAHRGAAFDACRWLIDTLKKTVPIWKKEHFEDGAVWADGEPFPPEIPKAAGTPSGKRASK